MVKVLTKNQKNIVLSKEDYLKLLEIYQKLKEILMSKKEEKKVIPSLKSFYGIWKGVKIDEKDFEKTKKSLFKTSL